MKIRNAVQNDLEIILSLYENARAFMRANGNPTQWGTTYPPTELVQSDIASGCSYVCEKDGMLVGTFYFNNNADPDYQKIYEGDWLNQSPYGVVHRITSNGTIKGVASFCLNWALEQCGNLKIDTHQDNLVMQHMLKKNGFSYCGIIYLEDGSKRLAYQKVH